MPPPVIDILLVDDETRNLDVLEAILASPGYRLLRAENADAALHLLLEHDVAAIVLDIKMPGVSGFELAQMIKNTKRFRDTPIVFLTAYMLDDQDVVTAYGAGAVDYMTKPVNPLVLRHKVAVFADLFRKTRELAHVNDQLAKLNEKLEERVAERTGELERSEAALRAASHQKDEFLAVLAHELRNPLAPLRTGLDLLLRFQLTSPSPTVERTLTVMNRQLHHMVRLIDDLLDISRLSRGLMELKRERIDLSATVKAAVESGRAWTEKHRQSLSFVAAAEPVFALADPIRITQIVTNLLHNAAKFTPENGSIGVELQRDGDRAVIRITDTGTGIQADRLERVFEMFARIERPGMRAERGLGIGLALARSLAEMHEGSLTAASEGEGRGTTFTLTLPALARAAESTRPAENSGVSPAAAATALEILIVEDNDDVAILLREWLESFGHGVATAQTGQSGVELVREKRFDVVLCDLGLPDIDGVEVCRLVRAAPLVAQPVMIALTGWGRENDLQRTKEAGFDHHLVKPVALEKLAEMLETIGEARKKRSAGADARQRSLS